MNIADALKILRRLAEGIDPFTGEVFPPDSPYQNAQTVRALYKAIHLMDKRPKNAGKPWSEQESHTLIKQYDSAMPIGQIAKEHQRTQVAIAARLVKLGKVENREQALTMNRNKKLSDDIEP
jgi:ATP-dependent RNA circularization protein (DNA/RNA ligase family)